MAGFQRQTAYKIWVSNILNNKLIKEEDGEFKQSYIIINNKKIIRVNIIATVVQISKSTEKQYISIIIDDTSGQIRIKTWNEDTALLNDLNVADTILLIGRVREYNQEIYITPEIVKQVDPLFELQRKLELMQDLNLKENPLIKETENTYSENNAAATLITEERIQQPIEQLKRKVINIIEKLDKDNGADMLDIIKESKLEKLLLDKVIEELIKQGDIYQIAQNKLKTT